MKKRILVLGGTGMLGEPVARALMETGFGVRIMTRDPRRARQLFDESFEIFDGSPADSACLAEAMQGCYGVHISLPDDAEQPVAELVAALAPRHRVERITYISGATVAEENRWFPMVDRKFRAEEAIRSGGTPYTIFCPTWVMETLARFVVQGRASVLGKQPTPYHWVWAGDIARMVAQAYASPDAANKRTLVFGPEPIRMQVALRRYCAAIHPEIAQVGSMPFWLVNFLAALTHNPGLRAAGEMMAYFEKIGEGANPTDINTLTPTPSTTLDQWLNEQKAKLTLS